MANSDKNIKITPNIGATSVPVIEFVGQGSQSMFLRVLDGSTASLSFEASEGQLFSITNNLSQGTIFSVNDISGIPFIELDASGTVSLNRFTGNTGIGTGLPTTKLEVSGTISGSNLFTNRITASSITSANIVATTLTASTANIATLTGSLTATNVSISTLTASIGAIARITATNIFTNILTASQVTAYGNLIAQNGQVHVGNSLGAGSWTRIAHTSSEIYGFNWTYNNAAIIINQDGTINQALVLGDTDITSTSSGLLGVSHSTDGGVSWTKKLDLYGNGQLYIGSTGSSLVWNADNDGTGSTLDADLLDGQHGTFYLNYTNIINKPTISDVTININSNAGLTGSGSFTLNQTTTASITISHADTSTVADVATASGVFISGLTFDTYGHVLSVSTASGAVSSATNSSFGFIAVSGQTTVAATTPSDILTLVAGTNITLSTNNTNKSVTINASSGGTAASAFGVISIAGQDTVSADDPGDTLTFVAGNGIILTSSATIDFITIGTNGTSSNISGAIVLRDTSGNFAATTVSANLFGTASNATALNGQTASYYLDWTNINNKPDPVITLSGDATGSVTLTDLNSGTLNLTITKDSSIILSGDLSGSAIMTDLGNVNISTIVLDDSHNHIIANIDDLQTTLDAKLSSSVYTAADVLSKILTVDGTGSTLDADLLDGQHGTYYLDYNNLNNKPIISNVSITVVGNAGLTGSGSFTLNQSVTASITVSHADTSNVGTITASSNIYLTGLGFDEFGHVLSATTGSVIITEPVGSKVYAYKNFGGAL